MRSRRKSRLQHGLSFAQEMQLAHGGMVSIFAPKVNPFESESAERQAWTKNRADYLPRFISEHPGSRPSAFWRFDLNVPPSELPRRWFDSIHMLLARNLISSDEATRCESNTTAFNPSESVREFGASFEDPELVERMQLSRSTLEDVQAELECARRWHSWRARPELAELFGNRAAKLREILAPQGLTA